MGNKDREPKEYIKGRKFRRLADRAVLPDSEAPVVTTEQIDRILYEIKKDEPNKGRKSRASQHQARQGRQR